VDSLKRQRKERFKDSVPRVGGSLRGGKVRAWRGLGVGGGGDRVRDEGGGEGGGPPEGGGRRG